MWYVFDACRFLLVGRNKDLKVWSLPKSKIIFRLESKVLLLSDILDWILYRMNMVSHFIIMNEYCKSQEYINVNAGRGLQKNMVCNEEEEKESFRSLVGQLGWLCTNSRLDLSHDVLELSCKINNPKVEDLIEANKCLRKACTFESSMYFPNLGDISKYKLVVYSDASHANLPDGSSAGGFVFFLTGENRNSCPLYWEAKKIRRVVKNTLAAETLAAAEAVNMADYLGNV